jgi:hypothetical protein
MYQMDQKKACLPRFKRAAANLRASHESALPVFAFKVVGFIVHNVHKHMWLVPPFTPKGANMTLTIIWLVLDAARRRGAPFHRHLYWQVDGGSENWGRVVFGGAGLLVMSGVVDRITISRLPVGHTHNDVDQHFSVARRHTRGSTRTPGCDIRTPNEFADAFRSAFTSGQVPDVRVVANLLDFHSWLTPFLTEISGYGPAVELILNEAGAYGWQACACSNVLQAEIFQPVDCELPEIIFRPHDGSETSWPKFEPGSRRPFPPGRGVSIFQTRPTGAPVLHKFTSADWDHTKQLLSGLERLSNVLPTDMPPARVVRAARRRTEFDLVCACAHTRYASRSRCTST